jgi:geranylgeranyl reductase family protein
MYDLIVIGGGPVGCYLSSLCTPDVRLLLLEEHTEAGNKACSGLVSGRFLDMLPAALRKEPGIVQHSVRAARIHIAKEEIELRKKKTAAYVVDRDKLDKGMAEHAISAGCKIEFGSRAENISVLKDRVAVKTKERVHESKMIAGCEGARSVAARHTGSMPQVLLNGIIAISDEEDRSDFVEMWFDKNRTDRGFIWKIPRGSSTEYGAMGRNVNFPLLEKFFRLDRKNIMKRGSAPIPAGLVKTYSSRLILAGDAACQTKPWSGGGLTYGFLCAQAAADVIKDAVKSNDFSEGKLSGYEDIWKGKLIRDIEMGMVAMEIYNDLDGQELKSVIKRLKMSGMFSGDIDFDFPFSLKKGEVIGI